MSPALALLLWFILLLALLRYDPAKDPTASPALWVPLIWMFIIGSRLPSQWLGPTATSTTMAFAEGEPLDRVVYLVLIVLALYILVTRRVNWRGVFARNSALTLFLLLALASATWSDFPFVTFKRWIRDLGTYLMVLVVLSEPRPLDAISTFIRRLSYLLIPLSVVVVKYYPEISRHYEQWSGRPEYVGVATSKNMLGAVCLVSGLFFFWDTLRRWPMRRARQPKRILAVNIAFIAMTLWLIDLSNSATSKACLVIGCLVIAIVRSRWASANPRGVTVGIPVVLTACVVLDFAFDLSSLVAQLLGREPTLTGRTEIWNAVLNMQTNLLVGVGYQSFWLGDRLTAILTTLNVGFLNEAHNGYLETYLTLGLIGLAVVCLFMVSAYRGLCRQFTTSPHLASLGHALWAVMVFYNVTEAAFGSSLLWCTLLLCVIVVPRSGGKMPSETKEPNRRTLTYLQRQASLPDVRRV